MYYFREILVITSFICPVQVAGLSFLFQSGLGDGSHFTTSATVAEALVRRGHDVTYLISNACEFRTRSPRWGPLFKYEIFKHSYPPEQALDRMKAYVQCSVDEGIMAGVLKYASGMITVGAIDCDDLFSDTELIQRLKNANFDAFVADVVWPCSSLVGERLNVTQVLVNPSGYIAMLAAVYGSPVNSAYNIALVDDIPSNPMTFLQRVKNVIMHHVQLIAFVKVYDSAYVDVMKKHNISPEKTVNQISSEADLFLFNMDFSAENALPLTPNIVTVGGLTTKPAKDLPAELEKFVAGSGEQGVAVFSLGTYVNRTNQRVARNIFNGLAGLPCRVVWKFDNQGNIPVPPNVKIMDWLPLNDLLGHDKTKVFIYQGGNNGFYEALYHGVPMVVLPVLGDQGQVAARVVHQGIGKTLDLREMSSDELRDAILEVLTNDRFQKNVDRLSAIYRDKPMHPLDKAAYWIEHVAKFGGKSYRPPSLDVGFLQSSLIDVYSFLIGIILLVLIILYKFVMFLIKCLCNRSKTHRKGKKE